MSSRPARPTRPVPPAPEIDDSLTPVRAHYLKKSLIQLQFRNELDDISNAPADNASTLAYLGPPFAPPPKGAKILDLPFLRYIFRHFVLTFPFMAAAPKDFYSDKLQPFVASIFTRNLSPTVLVEDADGEDTSETMRLKILAKVERHLAMFFTSGTKLVEPEQLVRLSQSDLDRLENVIKKRRTKTKDAFDVNIVCIRTVTDKGRVRSRAHDEFIIRTRLSKRREICVSRRYGDFRTLADELRKAHPDELVPSPPAKDRTAVDLAASPIAQPHTMSRSSTRTSFDNLSQDSFSQLPPIPGEFYSQQYNQYQSAITPRLSREKNRLTLRAYLHTLLSTPCFTSSPVLRSFLLSGPTQLTPAEQEDAQRREEADHVREEGRKRFAREIGARVDALRDAVRSVKGEIVRKNGLTNVFAVIKVTSDVRQLPENYQAVIEWARISLASTLFQTYVASDNSSETFASLKRIHGLMPYFLLKAALRISNPVGMIRSVLDIFLAQPFGGRSLLQRMFTSSLSEEVKSLTTYIQHVSEKIDDPMFCEKVRTFVYAPREIQDFYRTSAAAENVHILHVIMHGSEEPMLDRAQLSRIGRAGHKWERWEQTRKARDEDSDDDGPSDEEAWLFEDLRILVKLYSRLRDREQLIALIFEGVTAELLKDIITIFYAPLAQVYRAASITDSLSDLQNFINDLIHTVEQTEDLSQTDPTQTVQAFIDLVSRHEQAFYTFVHNVHSKGAGLFDNLMGWIERFLTVMRVGIGAEAAAENVEEASQKIALETLLPAAGEERAAVLEEVDKVVRYHYAMKVAHEERVRSRFGRSQGGKGNGNDGADATDEETQALVNSVMSEIDFGELARGNADELFAEETDDEDDSGEEETDEEDSSEFETDSEEEAEISGESFPSRPLPNRQVITSQPTHTISQPTPPEIRQRSFSLRNARSMTYLRNKDKGRDPPPVPPLPTRFEKPLPPRPPESSVHSRSPSIPLPTRRSSSEQLLLNDRRPSVRQSTSTPGLPPPRPPRKKAKNGQGGLQPPELKYIPLLLPVFVEMVRLF
ncbi:hypothetical protein J3A83DRAFT_4089482 [Scleroderma citrinum]